MAKPKPQAASDEVFQAPKILREPQSRQVPLSGKITLQITATGKPLPDYQWYHNGKKIAGAMLNRLTIQHLRRDQGGAYHCEVKNHAGSVMSRAAMVSFLAERLPELIVEPAEAKIPEGRPFAFRIVSPDANRLKEFRLQWVFNGKKIRGAMGTKLEFLQVKKKYSGEYKVRIVLDDQIITSNCVKLTAVPNEAREEVKSALDEMTREVLVKKPEPLFFDPNEIEEEENVEKLDVDSASPTETTSPEGLPPALSLVAAPPDADGSLEYPLTENSQISLSMLPALPNLELSEEEMREIGAELPDPIQDASANNSQPPLPKLPSKTQLGRKSAVLDLSVERKRLFLEKLLWHWQERFSSSEAKKKSA